MSISENNELQLGQNGSESTSITERSPDSCHEQKLTPNEDEDAVPFVFPPPRPPKFSYLPMGITRKELDIIKLTAQFVAVYGFYFKLDLAQSVFMIPELEPHFVFLKKSFDNTRHFFYGMLVLGYSKVLLRSQKVKKRGTSTSAMLVDGFLNLFRQLLGKEEDEQGVEMAAIEFQALQYFVNMEYIDLHDIQPDIYDTAKTLALKLRPQVPDAEPISFPSILDQGGITRKELDIIKLTAQFVSVFGMCFRQALMKAVVMKPEVEPLFRFLLSTDSTHDFYSQLTIAYTRVLLCIEKLMDKGASTETVIEGFFNLIGEVLEREKEEIPEIAIVDLHAFEYFIKVEYTDWLQKIPGYLSVVKKPPPHMQPPLRAEDTEPKIQTFDESTLVPEDQLLAQHPGPSTIRVSVPTVDDGEFIEITVQSLSENVTSLKEKIANKLELSGKAGVFKDDKSLAHYNVGAGDILKLSLC